MFRIRTLAAGVAVAAAAVLATAIPASAHDSLISTTPETGASVETIEQVTLTYSAEILDEGFDAQVLDADGTDWVSAIEVDGTDLVVSLKPDMPAAEYTVKWRVVSSDGHPISSGDFDPFTFTTTATDEPMADPAEPTADDSDDPIMTTQGTGGDEVSAAEGTDGQTAADDGDQIMTTQGTDVTDDDATDAGASATSTVLIVVAIVVGLAIVLLVIALIVRSSKRRQQ